MPQIKLVTNVSEYALLRGLARTRGRLWAATAMATGAMVGFGLWSAHYVLELSSSVGLNLGLITFNMMLMLVAAYLQTVLVGDLVFSGPWREQVILGEQPEKGVSVQNHNAEFMILLLLLVIGNGLIVNFGAGGFLDTYHTEGFFRSRLRSETPQERFDAMAYMTDPMNFELWEVEGVRRLVVEHLDDPDEEVQRQAIWNVGEMEITSAREHLLKIIADSSRAEIVRAEAAEAVGKLGLDEDARMQLEATLSEDSVRLRVGLLRGLALMKSPLSVGAAQKLTTSKDTDVMLHAFWVLRNSGEAALRDMLHEQLNQSPDAQRRCALLDTLKMVANDEDVIWARRQFDRVDKEAECEPVVWEERNERRHYVLYSDTFRVKYLKIVANASGGEHRAWFERIVADPDQPWRVREVASEIVKRIDEAGPKSSR